MTALFVSAVAATSSVHAGITQINYASVTVDGREGFDAFSGASNPINSDAIYSNNGMSFGKYFNGQQLAVETGSVSGTTEYWDRLDGSATGPLTLMAGAANKNLGFFGFPGLGGVMAGGGPVGGTTGFGPSGSGAGSIAVMFDADVAACGLKIVGFNGGTANFSFFRRDGSLIGSMSIVLPGSPDFGSGLVTESLGFQSGTGTSEIAGFTMWNTDKWGVGVDDFVFGGAAVPAPGAITVLGVAGFLGRRRR